MIDFLNHKIIESLNHKIIFLCLCAFVVINNSAYTQDAIKKVGKSSEEQWLEAVSKAKKKLAIKLASEIIDIEKLKETSDPQYVSLAEKEKIGKNFLKAPFNQWDFKLWYDAWFFKQIAEQGITVVNKQGGKDKNRTLIRLFFRIVVERIKPKEKEKALIPWPSGIWIRKFGVCDRQSWLLAELAYQAGFETQIIYLMIPSTGISPHTICEIRKTEILSGDTQKQTIIKSEVWTVDPFSQVLLTEKSVADIAGNDKLLRQIWPQKNIWQKAVKHSHFWTPSYPQDYCARNIELYKKLKAKLGNKCPKFGEDPKMRLIKYKKAADGISDFTFGLWFYPFRLLKRNMELNKKGN